jgi:branched-chain amino acid transport system substrate-binding protein
MLLLSILLIMLSLMLVIGAASGAGNYDPGASDTEIKIGNTNPYSGPASSYVTIGRALAAYFKKVNHEGGIHGRQITFLSYDDGYSPPKTVEQVRRLVEHDQVLFLFQTLGTPTNTAIWKYMNQQKIPQLFVATGATKWGDPTRHPWTMGWQSTYQSEAKIYAQYILQHLPQAKIGILYQNDDYGKDYVKGFEDGLGEKAKRMIVSEQTYEVTDPTVDSQIVNLKNSGADVFFNVTIPKFAAQAIRKAADIGWQPTHLLNSVSSSVEVTLKPAGFDASAGVISAFSLKDPDDPQWRDDPGRQGWLAWMERYYPEGNIHDVFNVYAYTVAQTLVHVLKQAGDHLTRENIMRQAANINALELPMLLPGIKVNTSPTDFYPIEQMQLAKFDGQKWVLFGEVLDAGAERSH